MRRETACLFRKEETDMRKDFIIVRGGGDLATGTVHRLWSAGFPALVLERADPAAIRRQVSLCEAVYEGETLVEGMKGVRVSHWSQAWREIEAGNVPVLVDPEGRSIENLKPAVVVDAILAKRNIGTRKNMAPLTIALGPGFEAGVDADYVIETKRGHNLGRIIRSGSAAPNTGIPGKIGGYAAERVFHAEQAGVFRNISRIGDIVEAGTVIAKIEREDGRSFPVPASIGGIIRGLLRDGYVIPKGFKIADIDPRKEELENCFTISDKARCIAGSVLELCTCFFCRRHIEPAKKAVTGRLLYMDAFCRENQDEQAYYLSGGGK